MTVVSSSPYSAQHLFVARCKFCKKRLGEKFYVKGNGACCAECYNTTRSGEIFLHAPGKNICW